MTRSAILPGASSDRRRVVGLLVLLFAITYLDRICISVTRPRMQEDLGIDPIGWGWVTGMFTLAYCLFEIPTGMMGDRLGSTSIYCAAPRPTRSRNRTGSYHAPFVPMTVLLLSGAALWVNVDASREVGGDSPARPAERLRAAATM